MVSIVANLPDTISATSMDRFGLYNSWLSISKLNSFLPPRQQKSILNSDFRIRIGDGLIKIKACMDAIKNDESNILKSDTPQSNK